jgi:predicted GIY-YIG superfamily endonuclease
MCKVYLIHFDKPLAHAQHYLGYTASDSVEQRLARHKSSDGARILRACNLVNISYAIVKTWDCDTWRSARSLERKLKRQHNAKRLCPVCKSLQDETDRDDYWYEYANGERAKGEYDENN